MQSLYHFVSFGRLTRLNSLLDDSDVRQTHFVGEILQCKRVFHK